MLRSSCCLIQAMSLDCQTHLNQNLCWYYTENLSDKLENVILKEKKDLIHGILELEILILKNWKEWQNQLFLTSLVKRFK